MNFFLSLGADTETEQFLQNDFITLQNEFGTSAVKTANRKRIAFAVKTLSELSQDDRANIFSYIGEYCPDLKTEDNTFSVGCEDDLKMVLFGIEQRIANSVIAIKNYYITFKEKIKEE